MECCRRLSRTTSMPALGAFRPLADADNGGQSPGERLPPSGDDRVGFAMAPAPSE
jgi:hypothetical protein